MSFIAQKAAKKLFEKHIEQYDPQDPLYEFYTDNRGKQQRRKRPPPPGLSKRDLKILRTVQSRAHLLDKSLNLTGCACGLLPSVRVGWTLLLGLIPVVGDAAVAILNFRLVVRVAQRAELPPWLVAHMIFHVAVSAGVGFVPLVGDVVAAVYKASSRNAALLEAYLRMRGDAYIQVAETGAGTDNNNTAAGKSKEKGTKYGKKDLEQINPGAGRLQGEVILIPVRQGGDSNVPSGETKGRKQSSRLWSLPSFKKRSLRTEEAIAPLQ